MSDFADALDKAIYERDNARCLAKDLKDELARVTQELPSRLQAARAEGAKEAEEQVTKHSMEKDNALSTRLLAFGSALASKHLYSEFALYRNSTIC